MAFGKKNSDEESDTPGRYKVDQVKVLLSGASALQMSLNKHEAEGWRFIQAVPSDKHGWILAIYERSA